MSTKTGVLTKNVQLGYWANGTEPTSTTVKSKANYTWLDDLQSSPAMGGNKDSVEITTLADSCHTFMAGLESYGDSFDFEFLKRPITTGTQDQMITLKGFADSGASKHWAVLIPDKLDATGAIDTGATICTFDATCSLQLGGASIGAPMTYTLGLKPGTAITIQACTQ